MSQTNQITTFNQLKLQIEILRIRAVKEAQVTTLDEYARDRRIGKIIAFDEVLKIMEGTDE